MSPKFVQDASIVNHTTSSSPQLHVLYSLKVTLYDGKVRHVLRRYSEFVSLKSALADPYPLPPKRILLVEFVPSAWLDNGLLTERKSGLTAYLRSLLASTVYRDHPLLMDFLMPGVGHSASPHILGALSGATYAPGAQMTSKGSVLFNESAARGGDGERGSPIVASYYPSWAAESLPPNQIDLSKFDIIFFAFVTPDKNADLAWDDGSQETLRKLVASARRRGRTTRVVLSVGGWSGSHWFSQAVSTSAYRTRFCRALTDTVRSFSLDGIDIDWEYPNAPGSGNPYSPDDAANFLEFLKLLRSSLGNSAIISGAVGHLPWLGSNGRPLTNVSEYAKLMSFVNIMNYDVWGASSNPGPNAPLGNLCGTSSQPQANAQAALSQWTKAGMPASKLMLGLATYGYVSKSRNTKLSGSFAPSPKNGGFPPGGHPRWPTRLRPARDPKVPAGDLSRMWGKQIAFNQLVSAGALVKKEDGTYDGTNGYTMAWDDCSDTPYLFNTQRETVVSYDDTFSIADKVKFARQAGMAGCFTWSLDQDDGLALHNVICANFGKH